jgi:hypothetical protein
MAEKPKTIVDKLIDKIKNNKVLAYIVVGAIILTSGIKFYETIASFCQRFHNNGTDVSMVNVKREYGVFDFIKERYNVDTLRISKKSHFLVSRRDYEMHFIISSNWDLNEPIDEPAELRYKTYFLPKNAECIISAQAAIVCLDDIIDLDKTDSCERYSFKNEIKKIYGVNNNYNDKGCCNIDDYVDYRIDQTESNVQDFHLLTKSPVLKIFLERSDNIYQIEARRIKYKFSFKGGLYYSMELIAYIDRVGFVIQFGAPEKEFNEFENMFVEVTNSIYFKRVE